jgi:REP element-mobilizing transposase RayT
MTRTVNGERLFKDREKEILRKMIWQVADFSGVEVLTYCVMSNHFHVLVRVPPSTSSGQGISNEELLRRYRVLYPKPTKYQTASIEVMAKDLAKGGAEAEAIRRKLLKRMGDISEYMKAVKQRFSVWYNRTHERYGTLWAERFKSVLVEGKGNPLQTMAAYIDLNPVRAGIVEDPKDYRFCGYAEAVACSRPGLGGPGESPTSGQLARKGIGHIWAAYADGAAREELSAADALQMHRELIFGKWAGEAGLSEAARKKALKVLEQEDAILPRATVLRCRVRYFTDGAILGSTEFVRGFVGAWQMEKGRKYPPKVNPLRGADWQDLATIQGLRKQVFG